jgi:hypothetical protein
MVLAIPALAKASSIPLVNPTFEEGDFSYAWGIQLDNGSAQNIPGWTYFPNGDVGSNWAVVIPNVNAYTLPVANVDGSHYLNVPMYAGGGACYQDVDPSIVFQAGQTYTFTVALTARSDAPADPNDGILAELFYRPVTGDTTQIGMGVAMNLTWSQLPTNSFTDFTASFTPQAGDPCIGHTMGIVLYDGCSNAVDGSYFGVDNVRLTVVPEPSTVALVLSAMAGLMAYAWRKRK